MPNVSAILGSKAFWPFYVRASHEPLEYDILRHFDTKKINGRDYPEAIVSLPCGDTQSIEIAIDAHLATANLGLRNSDSNVTAEMGWWDDVRCHPHALRWAELTALYNYWIDDPPSEIHPNAAFILLAIFVGHGVDDHPELPNRSDTIRGHYEQLQLFSEAEIDTLTDKTLVLPSEDDYNWSHDDELGWVFGGEYPCYSIRNREHSDGSEGLFPFSSWSVLMDRLASSPNAK